MKTVSRPFPFWSGYFRGLVRAQWAEDSEFRKIAFGGRYQWVLDAIFQMVEWIRQPLRFDSVVLRTALDLDSVAMIRVERWRTNWNVMSPG